MNTVFGPCGNEITRQIKEGSRAMSPACADSSSSRQLFMETASSSNTSFPNHQHVRVSKPSRINPSTVSPGWFSSIWYLVFIFYCTVSLLLPPSTSPAAFPRLRATTTTCCVWSEDFCESFACYRMHVPTTDFVPTIMDDEQSHNPPSVGLW